MTVYLVRAGATSMHKIGFSLDVPRRLAELQAHSPHPLTLITTGPGDTTQEAAVHAYFHKRRVHGEWFDMTPGAARAAAQLIEKGETPPSWRSHRTKAVARRRKAYEARVRASGLLPRDGGPRASKVTVTRVEPEALRRYVKGSR